MDLSWYVVPNAAYDTDDQFGAGARAEVAWLDPDLEPYALSLVLHGYAATSGFQHHRFRLDRVGLGARHLTRVTLHLAWRQWLHDGYWGVGNATVREPGGRADRYDYRLYQPFVHLTVTRTVAEDSPVRLFGALTPKVSVIEPYAGSLLAEERPYGTAGGVTVQLMAGALHDTRDHEVAPRRGHVLEASGRFAPDLGGEAGGFGGPFLSARGYVPGGQRLVLAGRVMGEWLVGTVPFYEMVHWGGAVPIAGFGGGETLRGVSFGRWRAPGKAVANVELRWTVLGLHPGDHEVLLELAPFADAGTVWGAGAPIGGGSDPAAPGVHPAVGGGARVVFDRTFVGRADAGFAPDPERASDGTIRDETGFGFYLTFEHPF